ncbi:MAG TPA: helix-turn-helix transcriptional regulator [Bacillota bacterium]|nr:helix-turn-helix transcriptional regulator [Bacillota bacterium]
MKLKSAEAVYVELGKRIVTARKARHISQEQLATASDIDRSHMGFIEQGRRKPTVTTLYKIAQALRLNLEDLFKGL